MRTDVAAFAPGNLGGPMTFVRHGVLVTLILAAGCSGGGKGGDGNSRPEPLIIEPHESSSHLPGVVEFEGRATDPEDGPLGSAAMSWQVLDADGNVVGAFQGATGTVSLLVVGDYTAVLTAEDSDGKEGSAEHPFRVSNTMGRLLEPDNHSIIGIATPFDLEGRARTIAAGVQLSQMTFIGIDLDSENQVFSLPVTVPVGNTEWQETVTPTVAAGRYRLRLEVTTTLATESAEDNIRVIADAPPQVAITSPADGTRVTPGTSIAFSATASDPGGGTPSIVWTSSIEGELSQSLSFSESGLVRAKHRITVTATDENGLTDTDSVDIYVEDLASPLFVEAPSLPNGDARSVAVKAGTPDAIWAGTAAGLAWYAADTVTLGAAHTAGYNAIGNGAANAAACISTGECLFAIGGNGVSIRNAGDTAWSTFSGTLVDDEVHDIAESPAAPYLFFATAAGITRTDLARENGFDYDSGALGTDPILAVAVDAAGIVWAGTDGSGLVRLDPASGNQTQYDDGLGDNVVTAIAVDAGVLWVGTDSGLTRFAPATGSFERWDAGALGGRILAVTLDEGIVWAGTENGAVRLDPATGLTTIFGAADLPSARVNDVAVDESGDIWLACGGGGGGLVRYDGP